jgi:ABC-type uncharacterized transport system ATPase component
VISSFFIFDDTFVIQQLEEDEEFQDVSNFEPVENRLQQKIGISVNGLRKIFGKAESTTVAVHGMQLDIYEGEILSLLGHNGLSPLSSSTPTHQSISTSTHQHLNNNTITRQHINTPTHSRKILT